MNDPAKAPILECASFPPLLRGLTVASMIVLVGFGLWSLPALCEMAWSTGARWLVGLVVLCTAWSGYGIVRSRTQLEGELLTQTWLWTKRAHVRDVASFKLIHVPWLAGIIAPRLLVRYRSGMVTWFHSADARLLIAFAERVTRRDDKSSVS